MIQRIAIKKLILQGEHDKLQCNKHYKKIIITISFLHDDILRIMKIIKILWDLCNIYDEETETINIYL